MFRHLILALLFFSSPLWAVNEDQVPETATGQQDSQTVKAKQFLAVAAHPLATEAGYKALKNGGSAVDAAVAIQAMLTLVEPQSLSLIHI